MDSGFNGLVYYKIVKGNKDGIFVINSVNGFISLGSKLFVFVV